LKNIEVKLPYKYTARDYQLPLYRAVQSNGIKRACSVWHRRGGKDKTAINLITSMSQARVGIYYYFFPTYNQGRKILWDGIDKTGFPFRSHIPKEIIKSENSSEMKITLHNGSIIQVIGTDNVDSIVGTNPVGCVFSEYALQNPQAWDFIRPILAENGGWAVFIFTPRGKNHAWDLYKMAQSNPDWFCEMLTVNDTNVITPGMIDEERRAGMNEEMIQQEFYCSFEASNPGAYYAQEIRLARDQGRICGVPVESGLPVNTFWDLGMDDSTSIWLEQDVGREIHLVGYYENSQESLSHYVNWLQDWRGKHRATWGYWKLPHDGEVRGRQSGKTDKDFLRELGFSNVSCAPRPAHKEDAIEAVRQMLGKCWFDAVSCDRGIEALSQFRKEYNEINKVFKLTPVHDWASHGADAFQTLAIGHPGLLYLYNTQFTGNNFEIAKPEPEHDDDPLHFGIPKNRYKNNVYASVR
jgi:phage terminase large subunit